MNICKIRPVFFSPVSQTRDIVLRIAHFLSDTLSDGTLPIEPVDFTLPAARDRITKSDTGVLQFSKEELVVFGTPTYAGRVPNKALPFVQELFRGDNTPCISVVTFGNRNFDSSLTELAEELGRNGFQVFAAGAFVCEHVFTSELAPGRPDDFDLKEIDDFATAIADKLKNENIYPENIANKSPSPCVIKNGEPVAPYYTPLGADGEPAKFLKAKPLTHSDKCDNCGICVSVCPLGSINPEEVSDVPGVCIKCQACVKKCPTGAKYFDDEAFLSHVTYLKEHFGGTRHENATFL